MQRLQGALQLPVVMVQMVALLARNPVSRAVAITKAVADALRQQHGAHKVAVQGCVCFFWVGVRASVPVCLALLLPACMQSSPGSHVQLPTHVHMPVGSAALLPLLLAAALLPLQLLLWRQGRRAAGCRAAGGGRRRCGAPQHRQGVLAASAVSTEQCCDDDACAAHVHQFVKREECEGLAARECAAACEWLPCGSATQ